MLDMTQRTKRQARAKVEELGYTVHYDTGSCGDGGYGSRLYFAKPNAPVNEYGVPLAHAEISRLGRFWVVSTFGD